jgi:DNA mismatch endonuclease (patch repair protein)
MPAANHEYWTRKIERNVQRDSRNQDALKAIGWDIKILWECELNHSIDELISDLGARRRQRVDAA